MRELLNRSLLLTLGAAMLVGIAVSALGCGDSDSEPPNDPSYYKGPMEGKGKTMEGGSAQ